METRINLRQRFKSNGNSALPRLGGSEGGYEAILTEGNRPRPYTDASASAHTKAYSVPKGRQSKMALLTPSHVFI